MSIDRGKWNLLGERLYNAQRESVDKILVPVSAEKVRAIFTEINDEFRRLYPDLCYTKEELADMADQLNFQLAIMVYGSKTEI